MRKSLAMIGLPILLGGCGLPPALTAASWAIDGVSYLVSGKSVTDHALSEVAQQDCALFRIVQDRQICEEFELDGNGDGVILTASAVTEDTDPDPLAVPADLASFAGGFGPGTGAVGSTPAAAVAFSGGAVSWKSQVSVATKARFADATPRPRPVALTVPTYDLALVSPRPDMSVQPASRRTVSVIGSFEHLENARGLAARETGLNAQVRTVQAAGKTWHRVVVTASLDAVQTSGFTDAWVLKVCELGDESTLCGGAAVQASGDHLQVASAN